jgi:hypothetical protein
MAKVYMTSFMTSAKFELRPGDVFEFDDAEAARIVLVGGGRALTEAEHGLPVKPTLPEQLEALTVAELRTLAGERGVELGADVSKKADIIAAISAAAEKAAQANPT